MTGRVKQSAAGWGRAILPRVATNLAAWLRTLMRPPRIRAVRWNPLWPLTGGVVLGAGASIFAVAGAMLALDGWVTGWALRQPGWILKFFEEVTDFGKSGWFLWPIGVLLLVIAAGTSPELPRFTQRVLATVVVRLGFLFIAIGLPGLFTTIVKRLIGRARPYASSTADPYIYMPFGWDQSYASLPSGHATTAFAAAVAIGALWPRARLAMWTYAVIIAISRVALGSHYSSDVIAGAVVGTMGALLVRSWFAARGLGFAVGADGAIHAWPGPSWRRIKQVAARLWAQ